MSTGVGIDLTALISWSSRIDRPTPDDLNTKADIGLLVLLTSIALLDCYYSPRMPRHIAAVVSLRRF